MPKTWKNILIPIISAVILIVLAVFLLRFLSGDEDLWIKDSRGVYVTHGVPSSIPEEVRKQQEAIAFALNEYNSKKEEGMNFSSQCLGSTGDYAIDIAHVPRINEDNLAENQCRDFLEGKVRHFIELDRNGSIIKIA